MTTITALPAPPLRTDAANFSDRADAFMGALPLMATQMNAVATETNAAALTAINAPGTSATSATSLLIELGSKSLTIQTGKALVAGQFVMIANSAAPSTYMHGQITAYNSGTGALSVSVINIAGSGTYNTWTISLSLPQVSLPLSGGTITGPVTVNGALGFGAGGPTIWRPTSTTLAIGATGSLMNVYLDASGILTVNGPRGSTGASPGDGGLRAVAAVAGGTAITTFDTQNYNALQFLRAINGTPQQIATLIVSESSAAIFTASDKNRKSELRDFDSGAIIDALSFGEYDFLPEWGGGTSYGVLAQDAYEVFPPAIMPSEIPGGWTADYTRYVPVLGNQAKKLRARLADLEALVADMAVRLAALEAA